MTIFLLFINLVISLCVIRVKGRNPATAWAWLIFMISIPYIGLLVYFLIGQDSRKIKFFHQKYLDDEELKKEFNEKFKEENVFEPTDDITKRFLELNSNTSLSTTFKNELYTYLDGSEKFKELMLCIDSAKVYIHLEYYILRDDKLGNFLLNKLIQKAKEGVEVKVLVDAVGTFKKTPMFFEPLKHAGCEIAVFGPLHAARLNYRNHRKLSVIDGKCGFIGGFNIGDEYIYSRKLGTWRDTHIKIYGDAVKSLELQFMKDWNFCATSKLEVSDRYFPIIENIQKTVPIQILASGPDTKVSAIHHSFLYMIAKAKKYIYITTPYFMPDENILLALKIASLSGVEVIIIIPSIGDHPFVLGGNLSYCSSLLSSNVRCFMYKPAMGTAFIHSKQIVVDDKYINLGSTNFDYRSLHLNFEVNALIIEEDLAISFREQFLKDLENSEELKKDYFENLSFFENLKLTVAKLISPLL